MEISAVPGGFVRIAPGDRVSLVMADGLAALSAIAVASDCSAVGLPVSDGRVCLDDLRCPEVYRLEWFDEGGDVLFTSVVECAGAHYFPLSAFDACGEADDFSAKTDAEKFSARQQAEETFEVNAKRSFVPRRGTTTTFHGGWVELDHCDVHGIESPEGYRLASDCMAVGPDGEATLRYVYGLDAVPSKVSAAVFQLACYYLRSDVTPDRATGESTEAGFLRYSLAGRDGATGIPEIDAVMEQFGRKRYSVR